MFIHWDTEGDLLELRFGKVTPSYYKEIKDDVFERRDEKTGEIKGCAFFSVQKRNKKHMEDIVVNLPIETGSTSS